MGIELHCYSVVFQMKDKLGLVFLSQGLRGRRGGQASLNTFYVRLVFEPQTVLFSKLTHEGVSTCT